MKSCFVNKKSLALLAASSLNDANVSEVKEHLESCSECRAYYEAVARVIRQHQSAARQLKQRVPEHVLENVKAAIRQSRPASSKGKFELVPFWRPWMTAGLAMCLLGLILFRWDNHPVKTSVRPVGRTTTVSTAVPKLSAPLPEMMRYRRAVSRSVDEFDRILNEEAKIGFRENDGPLKWSQLDLAAK